MKRKSNTFFKKFSLFFGLTDEMTIEEKLEMFVKDQQHINLIEKIKAIRNSGYYEPNYDKPKSFKDIVITANGEPISDKTILAHERPIDFKNDIKAWKKIVNLDHRKELRDKKHKELQKIQRDYLFESVINKAIMKKMMQLD